MRQQESMIGNSPALAEALEHVSRLAQVNRPILIMGERGTGKELAAARLHYLSPRWEAPFIKVNCAAIADSLLESELFGHEPGAFTGATRSHRGRFERANEGTLFLDELGNMSLRLQEKLLRLVEYGEFERLGGQETIKVDVRVIAATHADLPALTAKGEFRADLLDRLSFDVVHLPPLRIRAGDIADLAEHFALSMSAELGWEIFPGFTDSALAQLQAHTWPGNVRELKNAVERSLHRWGDPANPIAEIVIDPFASPHALRQTLTPDAFESDSDSDSEPEAAVANASHIADAATETQINFHLQIEAIEKKMLRDALAKHGNNQRRTAKALGLSYDQIRGLVRKYAITAKSVST